MHLLQHFHELSLHPNNAKELKGLILQLAVQGKLTKKWREENPELISGGNSAEALLEKIKEEKARLVKEKKIRKEKAFPPVSKDEVANELPEGWMWCRMQGYLDVRDGTHDTPKYVSKGIPLVTSKNLYSKTLDLSDVKYISEEDHTEISKRSKVHQNDILFAMIGSIGNPVLVDIEPNFSIKNVALIKYYDQQLVSPFYVKMFLEYATEDLKKNSDGAVQSFVSLKKLRHLPFPLSPLPEQKAIVSIVEQLFAEVEQLEALTEKRVKLKENFAVSALNQVSSSSDTSSNWKELKPNFHRFFNEKSNIKKLRETILQLAVQGKLTQKWRALRQAQDTPLENAAELLERIKVEKAKLVKEKKIKKEKPLPLISEEERPYELPEGWVWCRLDELLQEKPRNGFSPKGVNFETSTKSLKLGATTKGKFDATEIKYLDIEVPRDSHLWLEFGDILIQRSNSIEYVGVSAIYNEGDHEFVYPDLMMKLQVFNPVSNEFIHCCLSSLFVRDYFRDNASGTSGNMPKINQGVVQNTLIPLPPLEEQKGIVAKVNRLMALCDELEEQVSQSKQQAEDLMQAVVREVFEGPKKYEQEEGLAVAAERKEGYG